MKRVRLLLVLLFALLPVLAHAQFIYTTNTDGSLALSAYTGSDGTVVIPDTTNGLKVTIIGTNAFLSDTTLTNVVMGTNITSIEDIAFYGCSKLANVAIPNNVTGIGFGVFQNCGSLVGVIIGTNVTSIGSQAFYSCTSLTNITIPNSVTSIGDAAFDTCTKLISVIFPNSVTNIGDYVLDQCYSLTGVQIPNGITHIGLSWFVDCYALTNIVVPDSVTSIGPNVFLYCTNMVSASIGSGVTNIGDSAFFYCLGLTGIYFRGNVPIPANDTSVFAYDSNTIAYYLPQSTGWGPVFDGVPTALWNPQAQTASATFGVRTNRFGFTITGTSNLVVVVEACTNLLSPVWQPVQTITLTNGSSYFADLQWTNYPRRFYRFSSQ